MSKAHWCRRYAINGFHHDVVARVNLQDSDSEIHIKRNTSVGGRGFDEWENGNEKPETECEKPANADIRGDIRMFTSCVCQFVANFFWFAVVDELA